MYPLNFNNFFLDFSMTEALKLRTFCMLRSMKETCTESTSSRRGHKFLPILPLRTTHKVPVAVQEDVEDTKIWSDYINISLYCNAGWKKGTTPFHERMPFNLYDFLWIFQNLASISMTFPGLEKNNGIPWLFQVFHDWIHPLLLLKRIIVAISTSDLVVIYYSYITSDCVAS